MLARCRSVDRTRRLRPSRALGGASLVSFVALVVTMACAAPDPFVATPHSIVLIDLDTVRADHLGCYGYARNTTPAIDRFAQRSVLFERAYSQAPNTLPSHASLMTAHYPSSHGLVGLTDRLPERLWTLAEVFHARGYATAAFVDGGNVSDRFGFDRGFQVYDNNRGRGLARSGPRALHWLRRHLESQPDQPFLLWLHSYDAHTPYAPPEPFRSTFTEGLEPSPGFEPDVERMEAVRREVRSNRAAKLSEHDLAYAVARYDGGLRHLDAWVGKLLASFQRLGVLDKATVVLLSDHGEEFQEHGSVLHEKLYATVTRVPLIWRPPGGVRARRIQEPVELIDVMPTLLALTATPHEVALEGRSLASLLRGLPSGPHRAISESPYFGRQVALGRGGFRAVWTRSRDRVELYDVRADPDEQHDLASSRPRLAAEMHADIVRWHARADVARQGEQLADLDPKRDAELIDQLRALGYLQ